MSGDIDGLGTSFRALGQCHDQQAILTRGSYLGGIHGLSQVDLSFKTSVIALASEKLTFSRGFGFALTTNGQNAIVDGHGDGTPFHSWKFDRYLDALRVFAKLSDWNKGMLGFACLSSGFEQAIKIPGEA